MCLFDLELQQCGFVRVNHGSLEYIMGLVTDGVKPQELFLIYETFLKM